MAQITPNLALTVWNNTSDPYNSAQLADNFVKLDQHDHSGGTKGIRIDGSTSIVANSIGSNVIGTNAVTADELSSSTTTDNNRAVGINHIKSSSIDSTKIVNGTITRSDLKSTINDNATPVVLASTDSLPTGAVTGDEVYYPATATATTSDLDTFWRLRYNGSTWDFVGGGFISKFNTTAISSSGVANNSLYSSFGSSAFNSIKIPFAGNYRASFYGTLANQNQTAYGTFAAGLAVAVAPSTTTSTGVAAPGSISYCSFDYRFTTGSGTPHFTAQQSGVKFNMPSSTASTNRYVQQIFGLPYVSSFPGTSSTINVGIEEHAISIVPIGGLTNWV